MAQLLWSALCTRCIIDQSTNNITLVDVLEEIHVSALPEAGTAVAPVNMDVVSVWLRSERDVPEEQTARFRLVGPDGATIGEPTEYRINLSNHLRSRTITKLVAMPIPAAGTYSFVTELAEGDGARWHEVSRIPLEVIVG